MELTHPIPTEVIQLLSASEAGEYRLVPVRRQGADICCYGAAGRDYGDACAELEVLYGWHVTVEPVADELLQRLLLQYYRPDTGPKTPAGNRLTDISSGQGFLMSLIGEALRDYASDIHL